MSGSRNENTFFSSTVNDAFFFSKKDYARRRVSTATAALRRLLAGDMGGSKPPGFPGTTGRSTGVQRKIFEGFCMGTCQKQVRGTLSLTGFAWKYTALGPGGRGI